VRGSFDKKLQQSLAPQIPMIAKQPVLSHVKRKT